MSETSTEIVPVTLAEDQLLQLAAAVAASVTEYLEARDSAQPVVAYPAEVSVSAPAGTPDAPDEGDGGVTDPEDSTDAVESGGTGTGDTEDTPAVGTGDGTGTDDGTDADTGQEVAV